MNFGFQKYFKFLSNKNFENLLPWKIPTIWYLILLRWTCLYYTTVLGSTEVNWERCTWETGPVNFTAQATGWNKISECKTTRWVKGEELFWAGALFT